MVAAILSETGTIMRAITVFDLFVHKANKPTDLPTSKANRSSWVKKISDFLSRGAKRRSMIRSLEQLDDNLLADIGLQRQSIESSVDRYLEISKFR
jgi:uncharacterized protein YjiS (DUF1127 family)